MQAQAQAALQDFFSGAPGEKLKTAATAQLVLGLLLTFWTASLSGALALLGLFAVVLSNSEFLRLVSLALCLCTQLARCVGLTSVMLRLRPLLTHMCSMIFVTLLRASEHSVSSPWWTATCLTPATVCAQYFYLCPVDIIVSVFRLALSERPAGYSLLLLLQLLAFVAEGAGTFLARHVPTLVASDSTLQ